MSTRIIISLLMFTLMLGAAEASVQVTFPNDMLFFCDFETKIFSFNVTNTYSYPVSIQISKSGSLTQFADVHFMSGGIIGPVISAELMPGEVRRVSGIVTLNRETSYGEKELLISLDWGSSITKSLRVVVQNCHSIELSADSYSKNSCLLTPVEYVLNMEDTGIYDETIFLKLVGEGVDYARLSADKINLKKDESKKFYLFFYPTREDGNFTTVINAFNDRISQSITVQSVISKCADFQVISESSSELCEGDEKALNITVKNVGGVSDSYNLVVDSPLKYSLSNKVLNLEPGSSGTSKLVFITDCGDDGVYNVSLKVIPKEALDSFETSMSVNVRDCYGFELLTPETQSLCVCESGIYNFTLLNKGLYEQEYFISENSGPFNLGVDKVLITPGGEAVFPGFFSTCSPGEYDVVFSVSEKDSCSDKQEQTFKVNALSEPECFKARITAPNSYELNELSHYNIPVSIRNEGLRGADYYFTFSGSASAWVYAVSKDNMSVGVNEDGSFSLLVVPPSGLKDNQYSLTINVLSDGSLISSKEIKFSKPVFVPQVVSQTVSDVGAEGLEYFILSLIVFLLVLIILNWNALVTFLRKSIARLYDGKARSKRKGKRERKNNKG